MPLIPEAPAHVAFIMDGNGRWAKARGLTRAQGHRQGVETVRTVVKASLEFGVKIITLYAFSTENWIRPRNEVDMLMNLMVEAVANEVQELDTNGVRLRFIGDLSNLKQPMQDAAAYAHSVTEHNESLIMNIAVNYGGRAEILKACRELAVEAAAGRIRPEEITEVSIEDRLYTGGLPDPDLLVRTGGDMRISNFLLYQMAYTELTVLPVYWPDFTKEIYENTLLQYASRQRRFGGLGDKSVC